VGSLQLNFAPPWLKPLVTPLAVRVIWMVHKYMPCYRALRKDKQRRAAHETGKQGIWSCKYPCRKVFFLYS